MAANFKLDSYKSVLLIYLLAFMSVTFNYWAKGEVITPSLLHCDIGEILKTTDSPQSNVFSDFNLSFIPELTEHMKGTKSGWLKTWTDSNEIGRPVYQLAGMTRAYMPSYILAGFFDSPYSYITFFSLCLIFLTGLFFIMLARELKISPFAAFAGGAGLAFTHFSGFWITFPMFLAFHCWLSLILWGLIRCAHKNDFLSWILISFGVYSILMGAFTQTIVYAFYLSAAFFLYLTFSLYKSGKPLKGFLYASIISCFIGALSAVPTYADIYHAYKFSLRSTPDITFFLTTVIKFSGLDDFWRFLTVLLTPEIAGRVIVESYPLRYGGLTVGLMTSFFFFAGLLYCLKKVWFWVLAIAVLSAFSFSETLFVFGIEHLFLNLSKSMPIGGILIPAAVIAVYGADYIISNRKRVAAPFFLVIALIISGCIFAEQHSLIIDKSFIAASFLSAALMLALRFYTRTSIVLLLAVHLYFSFYPLLFHQKEDDIVKSSVFLEKIRLANTHNARIAFDSVLSNYIRPNLNTIFGIRSIHSYNSLSSVYYRNLISSLNGDIVKMGRHNKTIAPDHSSKNFWMSGIGVVLADRQTLGNRLTYFDTAGGLYVHKVNDFMKAPVMIDADCSAPEDVDPRICGYSYINTVYDKSDKSEYAFQNRKNSLIIIGRQFNSFWKAKVLKDGKWQDAETVPVNSIFLGVKIPEKSEKLVIAFKPFARYAVIFNIFWIAVFSIYLIGTFRHKLIKTCSADMC